MSPASPTRESHQELHKSPSQDHPDSELPASPLAEEEKKDHTHVPRHLGVPVMGLDLLAEMKARQEKMAVKKVGSVQSLS